MKIKELLEPILMFSISGISVLAVITFILKKFVDKFINNRFDTKLEEFKSELTRLNEKYSIVYSKLHQDRFDIIKKLYSIIITIEHSLNEYRMKIDLSEALREQYKHLKMQLESKELEHKELESILGKYMNLESVLKDVESELKEFETELNEQLLPMFKDHISQNKIFFSQGLWNKLESIENYFLDITLTYDHMGRDDAYASEHAIESMEESRIVLEQTKKHLEIEFQKLLGVVI